MRRSLLLVTTFLVGVLAPAVALTGPASAHCIPPDGKYSYYKISHKKFYYRGTNVRSDWVSLRRGGTINYSQTKTMEMNASMTSTVTAQASGIFASVSASVGFAVGRSLSMSRQWSYTANVPADTRHKYRLHAYHYVVSFTVARKQFNVAKCTYYTVRGFPQRVYHAPAKGRRNVWRLDKAPA